MKTLLKIVAALAALAGIALVIAALLQKNEAPTYISIYGGPDEE